MVYPSRAAWLTLREHIGLTFATIWISSFFFFFFLVRIAHNFSFLRCIFYLIEENRYHHHSQINDGSLSWLGTGTLIKSGGI
jgi:hypothetical protein